MNTENKPIRIALCDSQKMFRECIAQSIHLSGGFEVVIQTDTGTELMQYMSAAAEVPDICVLEISAAKCMEWSTIAQIRDRWQDALIMVVSTFNTAAVIKRVFCAGGNGFISKFSGITDLKVALKRLYRERLYLPDTFPVSAFTNIVHQREAQFTKRELVFLEYCCGEYSYKQIADKMCVSQRTVETYRDSLFDKLNIHTRTGLALYALQNGFFPLHVPQIQRGTLQAVYV